MRSYRTGKRTKQGMFNDLCNAVTRYYINNFTDGFRQVCSSTPLRIGTYMIMLLDACRMRSICSWET